MKVFWFFFSKKNRLRAHKGKKALLFEKRSKNFYPEFYSAVGSAAVAGPASKTLSLSSLSVTPLMPRTIA